MAAPIGTPAVVTWAAGANPAAQNITVPAGANAAVMFWTYYINATGNGLLSATLDGAAPDQVFELATEAGDYPGIGVAVWYDPPTGSPIPLDVEWDATPAEGPLTIVEFLEEVDTAAGWRDVDAAHINGGTQQTITLTTVVGDLVVVFDQKYLLPNPSNESGYTVRDNTIGNNFEYGTLRHLTADATSESASTQDTNYSAILGVVFRDAPAGSPATLSSPTPAGTIGTQTSASIGATTDQNTGTLYAVIDTAANLSGVSAAQIKAGQRNNGSAALSAGNATVTNTSPSVTCTGLSASTLYSYAAIQNNANGDSNIVTGTFTTAAPGGSGDNPLLVGKYPLVLPGGFVTRL